MLPGNDTPCAALQGALSMDLCPACYACGGAAKDCGRTGWGWIASGEDFALPWNPYCSRWWGGESELSLKAPGHTMGAGVLLGCGEVSEWERGRLSSRCAWGGGIAQSRTASAVQAVASR